ncbi:hypothetical protein, partial [Pseudomonas syringae]|uniref:hypothetical protein n=1 Tax=Pseudomonas syringae TaxID=317 RepID=UPI001F4596A5
GYKSCKSGFFRANKTTASQTQKSHTTLDLTQTTHCSGITIPGVQNQTLNASHEKTRANTAPDAADTRTFRGSWAGMLRTSLPNCSRSSRIRFMT